jgi:YD repeat-containing protein
MLATILPARLIRALGNLTGVAQGVQTRSFTYSSMSRLAKAQNPESGTILYGYDPNGNLTERTDSRGLITSYGYDGMNRATSRTYNDNGATPTVTYAYDTLSNGKGRLTSVSSTVSVTNYGSYDALGRVMTSSQFMSPDEFTGGPDELYDFVDSAAENPTFYADLTNPQSLNKYQYVYGNPLHYIDPDGHDPCCDEGTNNGVPPAPTLTLSQQQVDATVYTITYLLDAGNRLIDKGIEGAKSLGNATATGAELIIRTLAGQTTTPSQQQTQTGTPPSQQTQPAPPPPPMQADRRKNKVRPDKSAQGPYAGIKRDPKTGKITNYTVYDANGRPVKRYRGSGRTHGKIKPPLVLEPKKKGAKPVVPRPARKNEIPN